MLQPIDRPLFWALVAVALALLVASLASMDVFDQWFKDGNLPQPAVALMGAFVGGGFALSGVVLTDWLNRRRARVHEEVVNRRYLRALLDELETTWKSYHEDIGGTVEGLEPNQALNFHYPIFGDSLPVYHGNIGIILNLEDHELRKQIVVTCTSFVTLMDCYRFNNALLLECENAETRARFGSDADLPKLTDEVTRCQARVAEYAATIRYTHKDVRDNLEKLATSIRRAVKD